MHENEPWHWRVDTFNLNRDQIFTGLTCGPGSKFVKTCNSKEDAMKEIEDHNKALALRKGNPSPHPHTKISENYH